jgi:hypothetical protein
MLITGNVLMNNGRARYDIALRNPKTTGLVLTRWEKGPNVIVRNYDQLET